MLRYNDNKNEADKKNNDKSDLTDEKNHAMESLTQELQEMSKNCAKKYDPIDYKVSKIRNKGR